jgi:hypothetical protein
MDDRAAPPVHVELSDLRLWRAFGVSLSVLSLASVLAWVVTWHLATMPEGGVWPHLVATLAVVAVVLALRRHLKDSGVLLHWDGQHWHWRDLSAAASARPAMVGDVIVAMDLGPWLLLKLKPRGARPWHARWVPATQRGVGGQWHALRCALYSPPVVPRAAKKPEPHPTE